MLKYNTSRFFKNLFLILFIKTLFIFFYSINFSNITHDSWEYIELAKSLSYKFTYQIDNLPQMNRAPGYPIFLSLFFFISQKINFIIFGQVFLGTITICLVIDIWEKIHQCLINRFNIIFFASCIYLNYYESVIMTETLYSFLIISGLWFLVCFNNKSFDLSSLKKTNYIFCAILLGWAVLTRQPVIFPIFIFFIFFFISILFLDKKFLFKQLKNFLIFGLIFVLIISSWMIRNYIVFKDEILKNSNATIIGYKTSIETYNHFYDKNFKKFVHSYPEPFIMIRPYEKPILAKYIYNNEEKEVEIAFAELENDIVIKKDKNINKSTMKLFKKISEKRYETDPFLFLKAPITRALKLIFSPRIGSFSQDKVINSSNSGKNFFYLFLVYNFTFIFLFSIGIYKVFKTLKKFNNLNFMVMSFSLIFIVSHVVFYSYYSPFTQSRYFIPLFPLLFLYIPNFSSKSFIGKILN